MHSLKTVVLFYVYLQAVIDLTLLCVGYVQEERCRKTEPADIL